MKFGPFTLQQAKEVAEKLEAKGIAFEPENDKELLAQLEEEWQKRSGSSSRRSKRGFVYDPAFIFVLVEDSLVEANREIFSLLELLPQHPVPDFNLVEYVCPQCAKVVAEQPGSCPTHSVTLIPWQEYIRGKKESGGRLALKGRARWALLLLVLLGLARLGYSFFKVFHRH